MRGPRTGTRRSRRRRRLPSEIEASFDTGAAAAADPDLVWPHWLAAQLDPDSPAFLPLGEPPQARNLTHRNWTGVGTLDAGVLALVDQRGLVTPVSLVASLDWWVRGPGGWQHPSRDRAVRQTLVEDTPVVRTTIDVVGGGSVSATADAVAGDPPAVAVELGNDTDAPVAVALVVRPWDPLGLLPVHDVTVRRDRIDVGRRPFVVFDEAAMASAATSLGARRLETALESVSPAAAPDGGAGRGATSVHDARGGACGAVVVVATHGRGVRVALPAGSGPAPGAGSGLPAAAVADAGSVVRGWAAQTRDRPGIDVALPGAAAAFAAQAGHLMTVRNPLAVGPEAVRALLYLGCHRRVTDVIAARAPSMGGRVGATPAPDGDGSAATWLIGARDAWRHTHDRDLFAALESSLRTATAAVERYVATVVRRGSTGDGQGPLLRRAGAALEAAGRLGAAVGVEDVAAAAPALAAAARDEADARLAGGLDAIGSDPAAATEWLTPVAGEGATSGSALAAVLAAVPSAEEVGVAARTGGVDLVATLRIAEASARARDARAWALLRFALQAASPTWTWPSVWNPRTGGGCAGTGQDLRVAALFVLALRQCLVAETPDGLAVLPVPAPPGVDAGESTAVSGVPTPFGRLDVQVRREGDVTGIVWRGLWGARTPVLTAPVFDPGWRTEAAAGSATLRA